MVVVIRHDLFPHRQCTAKTCGLKLDAVKLVYQRYRTGSLITIHSGSSKCVTKHTYICDCQTAVLNMEDHDVILVVDGSLRDRS